MARQTNDAPRLDEEDVQEVAKELQALLKLDVDATPPDKYRDATGVSQALYVFAAADIGYLIWHLRADINSLLEESKITIQQALQEVQTRLLLRYAKRPTRNSARVQIMIELMCDRLASKVR